MDDRVFIRHPDQPHRNGYVTRRAYDNLWARKGYVIEGDETHEETVAPSVDESTASEPQEDEATEAARLQGLLAAHGVKVDKRWGLKRLRTEAAAFQDTE